MNKEEARKYLITEIDKFRFLNYADLKTKIDNEPFTKTIDRGEGKYYNIEIQTFWDSKKEGNIRVIGSVDDGGWTAIMVSITDDFIRTPDGKFLGE